MDIYIEKGYLHNDRDIIIAKGPAYCTTAYGNKAEMSRHTTLEWAEIAKYPLDIQLALPRTGKMEKFLGRIFIPTQSEKFEDFDTFFNFLKRMTKFLLTLVETLKI